MHMRVYADDQVANLTNNIGMYLPHLLKPSESSGAETSKARKRKPGQGTESSLVRSSSSKKLERTTPAAPEIRRDQSITKSNRPEWGRRRTGSIHVGQRGLTLSFVHGATQHRPGTKSKPIPFPPFFTSRHTNQINY